MTLENSPYFAKTDTTNPEPDVLVSGRAIVTPLYAVIPESVIYDNTRSNLPLWEKTDCWVLSSPAIGYSASFGWYLMFLHQDGGCEDPEPEEGVQSFIFVLEGDIKLRAEEEIHELSSGGFAYMPPNFSWSVMNSDEELAKLIWVRKAYEPIDGHEPWFVVGNEREVTQMESSATPDKWFCHLLPDDIAYDMAMNIISFRPGMAIQFAETHVMEHGLYMLQGQGVYLLNREWYEVHAGDYIWMRAYCPQAFYAGGAETTRYLLYKNINRQLLLDE